MNYNLREMRLPETKLKIRYFREADTGFLRGMGVDREKLPSEEEWFQLLEEDFARPLEQRQFYYLIWEADEIPIGHCNVNKIVYGQQAHMHLHIWRPDHRGKGGATQLLKPSITHFFHRFQLNQLFCEPYALNPGPNKTLPKLGFQLIKSYETTPGWITFHQPVNLWELDRQTALRDESPETEDSPPDQD